MPCYCLTLIILFLLRRSIFHDATLMLFAMLRFAAAG
jgi:hypothetical protein